MPRINQTLNSYLYNDNSTIFMFSVDAEILLKAVDIEGDAVVYELVQSETFPFGDISISENI